MTPATQSLLTAFATALRRERSARAAAADATREAQEAAQLQATLLDELQASGIKLGVAVRMVGVTLGEPMDAAARARLAARYRKRRQRRRSPGQTTPDRPGGS